MSHVDTRAKGSSARHSRRGRIIALVFGVAIALALTLGYMPDAAAVEGEATAEETEWVSKDGGVAGRELPALSADGRYVAYVGRSSEFNGVMVRDRATGTLYRVATGSLFNPDISADGRVVAFTSYGGGGKMTVYALDWQDAVDAGRPFTSDQWELVSIGDAGTNAPASADYPSLSNDGSIVAFQAASKTLDAQGPPAGSGGGVHAQVYIRNRTSADTTLVSLMDDESEAADGNAEFADITPDGRYVVFSTDAANLAGIESEEGQEEEPESAKQVYRRDVLGGTTLMVSVSTAGVPGNLSSANSGYGATISADGTRVAFDSDAWNLVPGGLTGEVEDDGYTDVFLRDIATGVTLQLADGDVGDPNAPEEPVIAAAPEEPGESEDLYPNVGAGPVISGNGAFVAFESLAPLTADDTNSGMAMCPEGIEPEWADVADVYRYDVASHALVRQSVTGTDRDLADGFDPADASGFRTDGHTGACVAAANGVDPAISADGARVAFVTHGNLTGDRPMEEEDHETEPAAAEVEPTVLTAFEPAVFLRRPYDEVDTTAPLSAAYAPATVTQTAFTVGYTAVDVGFPLTGIATVELWARVPGATTFALAATDTLIDGSFAYTAAGDGQYAFYTVATDGSGNVEGAPATPDALTLVDTYVPPAGGGGGVVETQPPLIAPTPPGPFLPPATVTARGKVCTIVGTAGKDVLRGTPGKDVICGLAGDDVIYGYAGADIVVGGPGNDRLFGGAHNDVLDGGLGNDLVDGMTGKDVLYGGAGNDVLTHKFGSDRMYGGAGNDRLTAKDRDADWVNGGLGKDTGVLDKRLDRTHSVEIAR